MWALARATGLAGALIAGSAIAQTIDQKTVDQQSVDAQAGAPADEPDFSLLGAVPDMPLRSMPAQSRSSPQPATIASRSQKADGSTAGSVGQRLPVDWDAKVGVDFGLASQTPLPGPAAQDQGTGWVNASVPAAPIGWDKATVDARVDPNQDQGKLSTSLSRSMPVGGGLSVTLLNGYSVTQTLANPGGVPAAPGSSRVYAGDGGVRLELPTATAFSAGARMSSTDDRVLRSLSAEQKVFDTPLSIIGSVSERPTGDTDKSIKAGFKRTW